MLLLLLGVLHGCQGMCRRSPLLVPLPLLLPSAGVVVVVVAEKQGATANDVERMLRDSRSLWVGVDECGSKSGGKKGCGRRK